MKLRVGDVIETRQDVIAIVQEIKPKNRELDDCIYLGCGLELEEIDGFSIIPAEETKWAWYSPNELKRIIRSASEYEVSLDEDEEDYDEDYEDDDEYILTDEDSNLDPFDGR